MRSAHSAWDGQVFSWDNPPPGGHPGEDHNCRCRAEPYCGDGKEYVTHDLKNLSGSGARWENHDFVYHFYFGGGRGIDLSQIGHLNEIAEHWAYSLGVLSDWNKQVIEEVRRTGNGRITDYFKCFFGFRNVEFSHGGSTVRGGFVGQARVENGVYVISGQTTYKFSDIFTDPSQISDFIAWIRERPDRARRIAQRLGATVGVGNGPSGNVRNIDAADFNDWFIALTEFGGTAYPITGTWWSDLRAKVFVDPGLSKF